MRRWIRILAVVAAIICFQTAFAQTWQWQNPLPQGNPINTVDMVDADHAWAAGNNGVLFRTVDGGANWTRIDDGNGCEIRDLCFLDALNGWSVVHTQGIFRTFDGGATWTRANWQWLGDPGDEPWLTDIQFTSPDTGWVFSHISANCMDACRLYVARSTDGGLTWEQRFPLPDSSAMSAYVVGFHCIDGLHAWLIGGGNAFRTTDGGTNWLPAGLPPHGFDWRVSLEFTDPAHGWLLRGDSLYQTSDSGLTWGVVNGLPHHSWSDIGFANANDGWLTGSTPAVLLTHDGGATWTPAASDPGIGAATGDFMDGLNGCVSNSWGRQAFTHDGGVTWQITAGGGFNADLLAAEFADSSHGIAVGTSGTVVHTTNGGAEWQMQTLGSAITLSAVAFPTPDSGFVVGKRGNQPVNGVIYQTSDGGATWLPINLDTSPPFTEVFFLDAQRGWVFGDSGLALRTSDGGATWNAQPLPPDFSVKQAHFFTMERGYLIGNTSTNWRRLFSTEDGGLSWQLRNIPGNESADRTKMTWATPERGWIEAVYEIYRTDDGGLNWISQYNPHLIYWLSDITFLDSLEGWATGYDIFGFQDSCRSALYAGFLHTTDGGFSWDSTRSQSKNEGWLCFPDARHLWSIGCFGDILYHGAPLPISSVELPRTSVPTAFTLAAYPNPFNSTTRLAFDLPQTGHVTLAIYDVTGRQVAVLVDETLMAGHHTRAFDGGALASGLYFARLESGAQHHTQKLVLLK